MNLKLKDILKVCKPDHIMAGEHKIQVAKYGIPHGVLELPIKEITGWDDGLTIELCYESSPCTCLTIPLEIKLKNAIRTVYCYSAVGGALHIVLDDGNVEDHHIQWCIKESIPLVQNSRERAAYERCAQLLLRTPVHERERIINGYGREWGCDDL